MKMMRLHSLRQEKALLCSYLTLLVRWPVGESLKAGGLQCCVGNDCKKEKQRGP